MNRILFIASVFCSAAFASEIAFLGVATRVAEAADTEGLPLPRGAGLVVEHLPPGGPAESVLEFDDLLYKLNDQILVNPEQLLALVRMREPGDEVRLTWFREGEEQVATLKLAATPASFADAPPRTRPAPGDGRPSGQIQGNVVPVQGAIRIPVEIQNEMAQHQVFQVLGGAPMEGVGRNRTITSVRDGVRTVFNDRDGDKHVQATRGEEVLFDGPVNTPAQRRELPANLRADLEARGLIEKDEDIP